MKQIFLIMICCLSLSGVMAQQVPTVNNPNNAGMNDASYWSRAGNTDANGDNNIFGTRWASPVYFVTGGLATNTYRMKLNGPFTNVNQYPINSYDWGQGVNTTGYLLLGRYNNSNLGGDNIYTDKGAFSLLHLNGEGSEYQEYGYRPWMKTGVTFTANQDLSYVGIRKLGTEAGEEDVSEMTVTWSDNSTVDDLVFRFTSGGGSTTVSDYFETSSCNRVDMTDKIGFFLYKSRFLISILPRDT